ncbi:MAG: type secretion protein, partial [Pseudonocardiales bacterium]|nr:type secretion protein [Pseudonocardiales bacterium]
ASVNPSLHSVLGVEPVRTMRTLAADPPRPSTRADFTGILTKVADDVWLIPADDATRGTGTGGAAPDAGTYSAAITPFARYFDITVTDVSSRPGAGTAELLLNRAHALCLVTSGDEAGFAAVTDRLQALRDQGGIPWAGRTVVVANQASSTAPRTGRRRLGHRSNDIPVVTLDFDPVLGPGFAQRLSELAPETHRTAMRLAAEILGTAMPSTV